MNHFFNHRLFISTCVLTASHLASSAHAQVNTINPQDFLNLTAITDFHGSDDYGYANSEINSINYISWNLYTHGNQQFAAFYYQHPTQSHSSWNQDIVLARRTLGSNTWDLYNTGFQANNINDSHDNVNFIIDNDGYMHLSWGMHSDNPYHYAKSNTPVTDNYSLNMGPDLGTMTGEESQVTYPQFFNTPSGDLLYLFREGFSGNGDYFINRYNLNTQTWSNVHEDNSGHLPFLSGQGFSPNWNSYPNRMTVDSQGTLHLTWTNRYNGSSPAGESGYQTNHNLYYAQSKDNGTTWTTMDGTVYDLPILDESAPGFDSNRYAELVVPIPEGSSLINQSDMTVDQNDNPVFATWWAPHAQSGDHRRQYMVGFYDGEQWQTRQVSDRDIDSEGWKKNEGYVREMARPIALVDDDGRILVVYRDNQDDNGITIAYSGTYADDPERLDWTTIDLTEENLGYYEPTYDPILWERENKLHLFYQPLNGFGNTFTNSASQVSVLEWDAAAYFDQIVPEPNGIALIASSSYLYLRRRH